MSIIEVAGSLHNLYRADSKTRNGMQNGTENIIKQHKDIEITIGL